jgi:hypothetical protein
VSATEGTDRGPWTTSARDGAGGRVVAPGTSRGAAGPVEDEGVAEAAVDPPASLADPAARSGGPPPVQAPAEAAAVSPVRNARRLGVIAGPHLVIGAVPAARVDEMVRDAG